MFNHFDIYLSFQHFALSHHINQRIAPPNPQLTVEDTSIPVEELQSFIGQTGVSKTPLRPVGICEFNGKRVSCVAEFGMIDSGTTVEGLRRKGANLTVREISVS